MNKDTKFPTLTLPGQQDYYDALNPEKRKSQVQKYAVITPRKFIPEPIHYLQKHDSKTKLPEKRFKVIKPVKKVAKVNEYHQRDVLRKLAATNAPSPKQFASIVTTRRNSNDS